MSSDKIFSLMTVRGLCNSFLLSGPLWHEKNISYHALITCLAIIHRQHMAFILPALYYNCAQKVRKKEKPFLIKIWVCQLILY
jgi:hypothetical protein